MMRLLVTAERCPHLGRGGRRDEVLQGLRVPHYDRRADSRVAKATTASCLGI